MVRTRCYRDGVLTDSDFSLDDVSEHLKTCPRWCGWICAVEDLQLVADELGLHSLAVKNATNRRQPRKSNRSSGHDFLTVYAVHLDVKTGELVTGEIAAFSETQTTRTSNSASRSSARTYDKRDSVDAVLQQALKRSSDWR